MNIKIELLGRAKVSSILSRLGNTVNNLQPAFRQIGQNFRELEKQTFESQGRPKKWKALSAKYAKWKANKYPGAPIMVLTGSLKKSLTSRGGDHVEKINRKWMEIGTRDPKGYWHQVGAGKLPVRKVISPKARDITEWVNIIRSFIIEKMRLKRSAF